MRNGAYVPYAEKNTDPRYIVIWSMHWDLIWFERREPGDDLRAAMVGATARLAADGWIAENESHVACIFIRKAGHRRLLMLTPRDPRDVALLSFDPNRRRFI